jgi:hypothetical protein
MVETVAIERFYFYITVEEALKLLERTDSVEIKTYQRPKFKTKL